MENWSTTKKVLVGLLVIAIIIGLGYYFGWFGAKFKYTSSTRMFRTGGTASNPPGLGTSGSVTPPPGGSTPPSGGNTISSVQTLGANINIDRGAQNLCGAGYVTTYPVQQFGVSSCPSPDGTDNWIKVNHEFKEGKQYCCWKRK